MPDEMQTPDTFGSSLSGLVHRSLAEEAYLHIKRMILAGELKSGDKISEKDIAQTLGVSRTPIREALKMLEQYGVVIFKPRSYAKVASITREETIDLALVRIEIEKLAIASILANPERFQPRVLSDIVARSLKELKAGNMAECFLYDSEFHLELGRQSGNTVLYDIMQRLDSKSQLVRVHSRTAKDVYRKQLKEHLEIVQFMKQGLEKEAVALLAKHITPRSWEARDF